MRRGTVPRDVRDALLHGNARLVVLQAARAAGTRAVRRAARRRGWHTWQVNVHVREPVEQRLEVAHTHIALESAQREIQREVFRADKERDRQKILDMALLPLETEHKNSSKIQ